MIWNPWNRAGHFSPGKRAEKPYVIALRFQPAILVPRGRDPCGQRHESRPLAGTEAGSSRITDFRPLCAASEIWNNNGYHRLQKWAAIALARYPGPCSQRSRSVALAKRIAALGAECQPAWYQSRSQRLHSFWSAPRMQDLWDNQCQNAGESKSDWLLKFTGSLRERSVKTGNKNT